METQTPGIVCEKSGAIYRLSKLRRIVTIDMFATMYVCENYTQIPWLLSVREIMW